jgi:hypothetical protein
MTRYCSVLSYEKALQRNLDGLSTSMFVIFSVMIISVDHSNFTANLTGSEGSRVNVCVGCTGPFCAEKFSN